MKFLTIATDHGPRMAIKISEGILEISQIMEFIGSSGPSMPPTLGEAISASGGLEEICSKLEPFLERVGSLAIPEDRVRVTRPFLPQNIICVGLNYRDHALECNRPLPKQPILFAKWNSAMIGPNDAVVLSSDSSEVDYEAELAVVIGKKCRNVSEQNALNYVAGYTCANDISARDLQRLDGQWVRAKSQDTFGPIGPYVVTRDEIPDPQTLSIRCLVNGRELQNSNTREMIFGVKQLIAFISRGITLHPGDVISTGTPSGIGQAQSPPVYLKAGDKIVVEIDKIGRLSNPIATSF
jgi:2-keto-4-pentenoate hydratase/2-oxohepta-3-ene-1,7-dioic acid hydratase in catechol pathway